jgi:ABC-type Na+ efflux pump permease subunit
MPIIASTVQLCVQHYFSDQLISDPLRVTFFVLICGSGAIGSQLNDGTLSLVLSRPVTITKYVFSKWFAVSSASSIAAIVQLLCELAVALNRTPAAVSFTDVAINGTERILVCFGFAAVMILLSALVSGIKDLGLYLLLSILGVICSMLSQIKSNSVPDGLARVAVSIMVPFAQQCQTILDQILQPFVDLSPLLSGAFISLHAIASYLAVITLFLSLAIFSLNRRELPYGAD